MSRSGLLEKLVTPDYARVKRVVDGIIDDLGITSPPVNPVDVARQLGLEVEFATFGGKFYGISGFYDCDSNAIIVNAHEYPLRQTFTVAHELGHHMLHREWAKTSEYTMLMRDSDYNGSEAHEKEANAFAGNLLVPRFMLDRYWQSTSVEGLSKLFAVSVPVIKNRISLEYGV
ncbi:Zn-dependent peptidase ImmA (M78 family) [Rhizobium sp. OAE497]